MADGDNDVNIEIGVNVSVVVEHCIENIIAVCLKHKGKEFRGVLMQCNVGLFPAGIPHSSPLKLRGLKEESITRQTNVASFTVSQPENLFPSANNDSQRIDIPAVVQRFSYNNDPLQAIPRVSPELTVVEMKPVGPRKRTIRDIRLRPRQTLCSNCKCAIHDGKKNRNTSLPVQKESVRETNEKRLRSRACERTTSSSSLPTNQRKRRCPSSSPMVLLEDITRKSSKFSPFTSAKFGSDNKSRQCPRQNDEKLVNGDSSAESVTSMSNKPRVNIRSLSENNAVAHSHSQLPSLSFDGSSDAGQPRFRKNKPTASEFTTKRTPAIKISIGDGDILKIPPRLPESEVFLSDNSLVTSKCKTSDTKESQIHKKSKKSGRKSRDKERHRSSETVNGDTVGSNMDQAFGKSQKKHKKKHRHRHQSPTNNPPLNIVSSVEVKEKPVQQLPTKIKVGDVFIDVVNISDSESDRETCNGEAGKDENHENTSPSFDDLANNRPRLVYTLKQDQGLSQVATTPEQLSPEHSSRYLVKTSPSIMPITNSPHRRKNASPGRVVSASPNIHFTNTTSCLLKDYPLRSKTSCSLTGQPTDLLSLTEHNVMHPSEDSQSHSSGLDSHISDSSEESGEEQQSDDIFSSTNNLSHDQEDKGSIKPLMMKIQTQNVNGCLLEEGREIHVGDIVWGKIQGFPWWPGQVSGITVTQRDNDVVITQLANVAWFGSNTMSHVRCCDLFPFLEDFKVRYNKKKKGQYRQAIKQATLAAGRLHAGSTEDILDFLS